MRALGCLAVALLLSAPAHAEDPAQDRARAHFQLGRAAFSEKNFREALAEFSSAYAIAPNPDLLYNVARCHEQLHQNGQAIEEYRKYLRAKPDADERAELERHIAELATPEPKQPPPVPTPPPTVRAPALALAPSDQPPPVPIYRRWWLWTAIAAVVAIGAGVAIGLAFEPSAPSLGFPAVTLK